MIYNGWTISKELYACIKDTLSSGIILELGSGEGTKLLCESYTVHSIEHNPQWIGYAESNYIHAPIRQYPDYKWYDIDKLGFLPDYDLLLVDGPTGSIGRWGFYKNIGLFNTDVPIILDDTHRPEEKLLAEVLAFEFQKELTEYGTDKKFTVLK